MTFNEVILGTSPFIFSPQFGHRTRLYELDFEKQPENIAEILNKSYEMGVTRILLNRSDDLERALDLSIKEGYDWKVTGFSRCEKLDEDMEIFNRYEADTIILDGFFIDENIENNTTGVINDYLTKVGDNGFIPAIETRTPFKNLPVIRESDFYDNFDELLMPLNFYGYMMDCNFLNTENKEKIGELLSCMDKKIIANRTLATGILQPKEAYEFISKIDYLNSVCVGVAKVVEAEETFKTINEYKS